MAEDGRIDVEVEVTNTGSRTGKETVMMFLRDHYASVVPPVKKLKAFRKISLQPGESKRLGFEIQTDDLKFVGRNNRWISEEGTFSIIIGEKEASFVFNKS
jgi:beta-glucosidase